MTPPVINPTGYDTADDVRCRLRECCKKTSQKEVAAQLGISEQYLSDLIKGRRDIGGIIAEKLGRYARDLH